MNHYEEQRVYSATPPIKYICAKCSYSYSTITDIEVESEVDCLNCDGTMRLQEI